MEGISIAAGECSLIGSACPTWRRAKTRYGPSHQHTRQPDPDAFWDGEGERVAACQHGVAQRRDHVSSSIMWAGFARSASEVEPVARWRGTRLAGDGCRGGLHRGSGGSWRSCRLRRDEVGRQPYRVGLLRTADSVSPLGAPA